MGKRKTDEEFRQQVYNLVGNEYVFLDEYKGSTTNIKVRHNIPNCQREYMIKPTDFLTKNRRCRKCLSQNKFEIEFLQKVKNLTKDEYIVIGKYINATTPIEIKHNILECNYVFLIRPDSFLAGARCPCTRSNRKTNKQFLLEVYNAVQDEYLFLEEYQGNSTKIKVRHNIESCMYEFMVRPSNFLNNNSRCPKCAGTLLKTNDEFQSEVFNAVQNEYLFLENYNGSRNSIKVKHNISTCFHEYYVSPDNFLNKLNRCPRCSYNGISNQEKQLYEYIINLLPNIEIIENDRKLLNGKEIDILVPSKNIGIEFNGLYWHSSQFKDKNSHLNKTLLAKEKNIQLIHIFEDEWINKQELVKKKLSHILNVDYSDKIYARNCIIKKIEKVSDKTQFLNENHIQGADKSTFSYGLYYKDDLVALMSFVEPRINLGRISRKEGEYELSRYVTKYNVIGGFGKLLKHCINNEKIKEIYTYADLRWTNPNDNIYLKNGFQYVSTSRPNYWYVINGKREGRFSYQKAKLKEKFPEIYSDDKTEEQIMLDMGYYRIYDCGNLKYNILMRGE